MILPIKDILLNEKDENVNLILTTLNSKEEKVLRLRLGLGDNKKHTLKEIGEIFNVTRNRIWQIEIKALRKLRHPKRRKLLKSFTEF